MKEDPKLSREEVNEATAYFNLASLLGKSIQAAAFQVQHPDYNPERIVLWLPDDMPPESAAEDPEPDTTTEAEQDSSGPVIYSNEVSVDDQIEQLTALYTPGVYDFLKSSALCDMFRLASVQFSFDEEKLAADILTPEDKKKMAVAWLIVKRVFAVRHPDETILIISAAEAFNRKPKAISFRPIDDTDREFIVETCKLCLKVFKKDKPLTKILDGLVQEIRRNDRTDNVGRLAPLSGVSNSEALDFLYRVVSNGSRIRSSNKNRHESIVEQRKGNTVRFTRSNKQTGDTFIVEIAQADKYLSKTSKTFKKLFLFSLQKMAAQNEPLEVGFSLQELVDLGMYANASNAARGVREFFAQQKQTMISGTLKKGRNTIREEGGILYYHYQIEGGYVKLSVNEKFNLDFLSSYYTTFPRFAYALRDNAFSLVRYIFFLARLNTKAIKAKGTFTIGLDSVRDRLGLPAPDEVKNRRYRQLIIEPIEEAIEEIEDALMNVPEAKEYSFTITPIIPDTSNINQWLEGYLEISLKGDFAKKFIEIAEKAEANREKWEKLKSVELAKLAAKKEIEDAKKEAGSDVSQ